MNRRLLIISIAIVCIRLGYPSTAGAHRLDEYLQATRVSVERDRIGIELDLTPGMDVAHRVFERIDTDNDGRLSSAEGEAYARLVLSSVSLALDGKPIPVTLLDRFFPDLSEMAAGVGTIRLRAAATFPGTSAGPHRIYYRNTHQPEISVYLVNALIPADRQIEIAQQRRDYMQHEVTIEYRVISDSRWTSLWWLAVGVAMACVLGVRRRSSVTSHDLPPAAMR